MAIYTKAGDQGQTTLRGGITVSKDNLRVATYGSIDELNCHLGVVLASLPEYPAAPVGKQQLLAVQADLFAIGSNLAALDRVEDSEFIDHLGAQVALFEEWIDVMTAQLPELKNFILPGGGLSGALLHLARAVTRRVERNVVALKQQEEVIPAIICYFNRLSDLLFTLSRYLNFQEGKEELLWRGRNKNRGEK